MKCKDCGRDIYPGEAFAVGMNKETGNIYYQCLDCADMEMLKKDGYASLDHVEKATVLKVIGQELEKTAWRIIKNEKEGKDHADN